MVRSRDQGATSAVEPRRRPQQERSQEMVERILGSAQRLMKEAGFKGLTTIAIAEQAGLSVGSLYQYFPNKEAIILDLARRWLALFRGVLEAQNQRPAPTRWDAFRHDLHGLVDALARTYRDHLDLVPTLEAMRSNPELRRINQEHDAAIIDGHAAWLLLINPGLDRATARRLGLVMLETGHACFSAAMTGDVAMRDPMLQDLETMFLALLRPHLGLADQSASGS
jgi:AcrR family transcriptional regulator